MTPIPRLPFTLDQILRARKCKQPGKQIACKTFGPEDCPTRFAVKLIATRFGEPAVFVTDADQQDEQGLAVVIRQYNTIYEYNAAADAVHFIT